jgi:hypothetical protein
MGWKLNEENKGEDRGQGKGDGKGRGYTSGNERDQNQGVGKRDIRKDTVRCGVPSKPQSQGAKRENITTSE